MASNNNYYGRGRSGRDNRNTGRDNRSTGREQPEPIRAEVLPTDYVDQAEDVMRDVLNQRGAITTSKIRNLLSLVSDIYNTENLRTEETLLPESETGLMMLRIRTAYECGRDPGTKYFVQKARILQYLKGIGNNRGELIRFAHYMEALVAYHRYFGGREN